MTVDDVKLLDEGKANVGGKELEISASDSSTAAGATKLGVVLAGLSAIFSKFFSTTLALGGYYTTHSSQYSASNTGIFTINSLVFGEYSVFNSTAYELVGGNSSSGMLGIINSLKKISAGIGTVVSRVGMVLCLPFILISLIRVFMSKGARDLAAWKKVLTRWVLCFALMFFFEYILIAIDTVANMILNNLWKIRISLENGGHQAFEATVETSVLKSINKTGGVLSFAYSLEFFLIVVLQILFVYKYSMRVFTMIYLFATAPIYILSHSVQVMLGKESGTLGSFFKTYMVNSFMQPVHAFFYLVFFFSFSEIAIRVPVIGILLLYAMLRASTIIKAITGWELGTSVFSANKD